MKTVAKSIFLVIAALLFFSCGKVSIDEMLESYNKTFSPDFGDEKIPGVKKEPSLIPDDVYNQEQPYELKIQANKGYTKYTWTFVDFETKQVYDVNTGISVLYINTEKFPKGKYKLTLDAENVFGDKFTDEAIVNIL